MTINEYDDLIFSLKYYAQDKRRNKDYRDMCRRAAEALYNVNKELKESQAELRHIKGLLGELLEYAYQKQ